MRQKIRGTFLRLLRNIHNSFKVCTLCGDRGIQGMTYVRETCNDCANVYQISLDILGTTKLVEEFIREYGINEFFRTYGEVNTNPMLLSPEEEIEEEIPCFDTYPAPASIGHPAQNCSMLDRSRAMGPSVYHI